MSINLASRLSAIAADSNGVNHIVWVEGQTIWHAQFDANAGTWTNAQPAVSEVPGKVRGLNLVANEKLINGVSPGLAVIWQAGDQKSNNTNFYYSAAQYSRNGQLQWDAVPTVLTVNETQPTDGLAFANLAPQAIVDDNGQITIVGQQVNVLNAANQTIREDTDLYVSSLNIASVTPAPFAGLADAIYEPPVIVNGVNQGPGFPINQTGNSVQANAVPSGESASVTSLGAPVGASSTPQFQGIGFRYGPSLSFSTELYKALGLDKYVSGIPGGILKYALDPYDLVGTLSEGISFDGLSLLSQGKVERFLDKLEEEDPTEIEPPRLFPKTDKGTSLSLSFTSETSFDSQSPYYFKSIEDYLAMSVVVARPIIDKPVGLIAGKLDFIGSVGVAAKLKLEPVNPGDDSSDFVQIISDDLEADGLSILLTFIGTQLSQGKNGVAAALIASTVFGPIENLLIGNLTNAGNLKISEFVVGPTIGADLEGELYTDLLPVLKLDAAGGVEVFFEFDVVNETGITTVLSVPLEAGISLGPIGFNVSIEPTWVWPSNPPVIGNSSTQSTALAASANELSTVVSVNAPLGTASNNPSATVAGPLLTLAFDAPLDTSTPPIASSFTLQTQTSNQSKPVPYQGSIGNISVSNDTPTGNGVVILQLSEPFVYSPQFSGANPVPNGDMNISLSYNGNWLEFSGTNTPVAGFNVTVTNNSPQALGAVFNPTAGNGLDYTVAESQTALIGTLEADYAQDSPPALALVTNSTSAMTEGQVLAVWSREVQPLTPIAGFVNANEIYLNFVQNLNLTSFPKNSQFTVLVNGAEGVVTVTNVAIEAGGYLQLNLQLNSGQTALTSSDTVVVSYQPSATIQGDNLYLIDAIGSQLWIPAFSESLKNTIGKSATSSPDLMGGSVVITNGTDNSVTLIFDAPLSDTNIPNGSQFAVVNNGQAYNVEISNVEVSGNAVSLILAPPATGSLIGQGDLVNITYTPGSVAEQNLAGSNKTKIKAFTTNLLTTLPEIPTTTMMAGFYTPGDTSGGGLLHFQNIPGQSSVISTAGPTQGLNTQGFNFDPAVAGDVSGNALAVWVYAPTNELVNLSVPGDFYTDSQNQTIYSALSQTDIYFSYWNGSQWSLAAPLAMNAGADSNVTVAYDTSSNSYIAAWLNTTINSSTNQQTVTIYSATYTPSNTTWQINTVLSEATPDPLAELVISSVNGTPALFWTQTQPVSYSQLTIQDSPVLYFRLGEVTGTTAQNKGTLGAMANGTYNGQFALKQAGALFDSSDDQGDLNPAVLFSDGGSMTLAGALGTGSSAFSVEFWFNIPSDVSKTTSLVDLDGVFNVGLNGDGTLTFSLANDSSITTNVSSNPIHTDVWYYVVGTYNNQIEELNLYLDGQSIGTLTNVAFTPPANGAFTLAGGTDAVYLDEVALYGNALSYSSSPTSQTVNSIDLLESIFNTDQIGEKYSSQYVSPLPPGPQTRVSLLQPATTPASWNVPSQINPLPFFQPTTLSDANSPTVDVVSSTTPTLTGNINPNGQEDTIFRTTINGFQNKVIESITLSLSTGQIYGIGSTSSAYQLGVVIGDNLINSTKPNTPFSYAIKGSALTMDLLVDTGSNPSANITASQFTLKFSDGTIASNTATGAIVPIDLPSFVPPNSVPVTAGNEPILGTATVTEAEDSSLTLIDSGFVINTSPQNAALGYAVASADFNSDGQSDVAVGNRGYTNTVGTINGSVQILMGGQPVLGGTASVPLMIPTSDDTSAGDSGNLGGFAIVGIPDGGQANGDSPLSLAAGDVDNDGYPDLVIGSPNNNVVYVILGSYLASNNPLPQTVIDVTSLSTTKSAQGYVVVASPSSSSGDNFGFAVTVGNFNGAAAADIVIGAPNAGGNGEGEVYVAYDSSTSASLIYTGSSYTDTSSNTTLGENAGYALATSAYVPKGASTFTGSISTDDLIIGAPNHILEVNNNWSGVTGFPTNNPNPYSQTTPVNVGAVYVFTSNTSGLSSNPAYTYYGTDATTPSGNGAAQSLLAGVALASDDWNGDAQLDLAIAAAAANENNGAVYILSGIAPNTFTTTNPSTTSSPSSGTQYLNQVSDLTLNGGLPLGQVGAVLTTAGDVNDDGYQDLLITAPQGANAVGQGYVVFGEENLLGSAGQTSLNLSPIASDSKTTFLLNGNFPYQLTGQAAAPIGDINDDGVDDLMITAPNANQLYAVYGHAWLADDGSVKLANISGDNGFVTDGDLYSVPLPTQISNLGGLYGNESSLAPAFINNNGIFYIAYVDATNNQITLVTSSNAGQGWSSPIQLPTSITTTQTPSIAFYQGVLYLAYVGAGNEINITYSANNGSTWSSPYTIPNQSTGNGVSLVVNQGQLMAFFVANSPSSEILYVYSSNPQSNTSWSTDYLVPNGSFAQTSSLAVSATAMGDALYIAYVAGAGSIPPSQYVVSSTDGSDLSTLVWSSSGLGVSSLNTAPSITNDGNQLYLTYANSTQNLVYATSRDGANWSGLNAIAGQTSNQQPASATLDGRLYLSYLGDAETADIYFTALAFNQALVGIGNSVVMLGDVNGDGFADVMAAGSSYGAILTFGASTQDLLDAATGADEIVITVPQGVSIQSVLAVGDFNGDGYADFGVVDQSNNLYLTLGAANLSAQSEQTLVLDPSTAFSGIAAAEAMGDYNGDGYDDILLMVDGQQRLYTGNRAGTLSSHVSFTANANSVFNGIGDVNGDGYDDIGAGNPTANGSATLYLGNQTATSNSGSLLNPPIATFSAPLQTGTNTWYTNNFSQAQLTKFNGAPSFAVYNNYLYMGYTGVNNSSNNGSPFVQRSSDGVNWQGLTNLQTPLGQASTGFSLAVYNNILYAAYLNTNNPPELIITSATPSSDPANALGVVFNSDQIFNTGTTASFVSPAMAVYNGNLYVFYATGNQNTSSISYYTYNATDGWAPAPVSLPMPPLANPTLANAILPLGASFAVTTDENNLYLSYVSYASSTDTTQNLTFATFNGTDWSSSPISQTPLRGTGLLNIGDTYFNFFLPNSSTIDVLTSSPVPPNTIDNSWGSPASIGDLSAVGVSSEYETHWLTYPNPIFFQEKIYIGYGIQYLDKSAGAYTNVSVAYGSSNNIYQPNQSQQFGQQLEGIGDFNGDGIADSAVLAPGFFSSVSYANMSENNQGALLIYYGSTTGLDAGSTPDVVLATPAPIASTNVAENQALLLSQFAPTGDVNGDGYDDLIIASPTTALNSENTTDGIAFVVFGGDASLWGESYPASQPFDLGNLTPDVSELTLYFSNPLNTASLPDVSTFTVINGLGTSKIIVNGLSSSSPNELTLSLASNVNISDFLSVAYAPPNSGVPLTYAAGSSSSPVKVATFVASNDAVIATLGAPVIESETYTQYGFSISGLPGSLSGISLSGGGDVSGDGFNDFLIGAPGADDNLAYTLFGSDFNQTVSQTGTIGGDVMVGSPTGESFVAGQGDDLITTGGGVDVVYAGPGDDQVIVNDVYFRRLDGDSGEDVLFFQGYDGQAWDVTTLSPGTRLRDFEILVTEDYGQNTLTLNALSVMQISPTNTLTIFMDGMDAFAGKDSLVLSSDFKYGGVVYQYNRSFAEYTSSTTAARVLVNQPNINAQVSFGAPVVNLPNPILPSANSFPASSMVLTATHPDGENLLTSTSITNGNLGTNTDATTGSTTQIYVSAPTVSERTGRADFTITRTGNLNQYVWIDYYTKDGDGKAGDRYIPLAGQLVFAPGESEKTVTVPIINSGSHVGQRNFGLAVKLEGESSDPAVVPAAWQAAMATPKEQIRRWALDPDVDAANSLSFEITSNESTNRVVTLDLDLKGTVIPQIWNPSKQVFENIPFQATNGIVQFQDINGDATADLYRMKFTDGGPFDGDGLVNGLVALDFDLVQLTNTPVSDAGGSIKGTDGNNYINAQNSLGTNRIEGLAGSDVLIGSPQRDVLLGGDGNDLLYGGSGIDQLYGGPGDDLLDGGSDLNFLYGGYGADNFVIKSGNGPQRVMDFNPAEGDLFLLENLAFNQLEFQANQIKFGMDTLAIVNNELGKPVTTFAANPAWFTTVQTL